MLLREHYCCSGKDLVCQIVFIFFCQREILYFCLLAKVLIKQAMELGVGVGEGTTTHSNTKLGDSALQDNRSCQCVLRKCPGRKEQTGKWAKISSVSPTKPSFWKCTFLEVDPYLISRFWGNGNCRWEKDVLKESILVPILARIKWLFNFKQKPYFKAHN